MTKEELEKEAEEYADWFWGASPSVVKALARAYIKGAEPREKQIEIDAKQIRALQKQNGELTDELTKKADTNHQLVEQLAKLNERCSEFEITVGTLRTFSNEQAACIERLAKENAKLKDVIEGYKKIAKWCDNCDKIAKLEKENAELKEEIKDANEKVVHLACNQNKDLKRKINRAKEIIKRFSKFVNNDIEYDPEHPQEHTDLWNELCTEAEQFLKGAEND